MSEQIPTSEIANAIAPSLVSVDSWGDASFLRLPMLYPSGSFVTVRLTHVRGGIRVSDSGFAYREIESFGAGRSFARTARTAAEKFELGVGRRTIYVDVPNEHVERAVMEIAAVSQNVADQIVTKCLKETDAEISEVLQEKLSIFFQKSVEFDSKIKGASSTEWDVSAIASLDGQKAIFQSVTNYPVAVYKASTAFHDISALENPPKLISVVNKKSDMGALLPLLAQAGSVIELGQEESTYRKAAGW